jgi:hypothetical protein
MRWATVIGSVVAAVMVAAIGYGFIAGEFGAEGRAILDLAWGRVTLIDFYAAMTLVGAWIVYREGRRRAVPWLIGLVILGSLTAGAYVARTAVAARGDAAAFWSGRKGLS